MSYDRLLDQVCPHQVIDETLVLDDDRQTIHPLRPISSAVDVWVRLNGALDCPSPGLYQAAQVVGRLPGPYTVTAATSTLRVRVQQGDVQVLQLDQATRMPPVQVATLLSRQLRGAQFFVQDGRVGLRTDALGKRASVKLVGPSPLAAVLGLSVDREWQGMELAPAWTLIRDSRTLSDRPTRLIVFDHPLRSSGDFVEVSYTTLQQECRRCGGIGIEYDWRYGRTGEVAQVRDEALLIQEVQKVLYTLRGSNPFHVNYGTMLLETIGQKQVAGGFLQNLVVTDIQDTFRRWQAVKAGQEAAGQVVSDREYPYRLLGVDVTPAQDPTVLNVSVRFQNRSFDPITLDRGIRLPDALAASAAGTFRSSVNQTTFVG